MCVGWVGAAQPNFFGAIRRVALCQSNLRKDRETSSEVGRNGRRLEQSVSHLVSHRSDSAVGERRV